MNRPIHMTLTDCATYAMQHIHDWNYRGPLTMPPDTLSAVPEKPSTIDVVRRPSHGTPDPDQLIRPQRYRLRCFACDPEGEYPNAVPSKCYGLYVHEDIEWPQLAAHVTVCETYSPEVVRKHYIEALRQCFDKYPRVRKLPKGWLWDLEVVRTIAMPWSTEIEQYEWWQHLIKIEVNAAHLCNETTRLVYEEGMFASI